MSDPGNVVQISVKVRGRHRKGVLEAPKPACQHRSVLIDEMASEVECETCGAKLSATAWLVEFMDAINRVYLDAAADYRKAKTEYEIKRRCKCQHCGRISEIRHPTPAEINAWEAQRISRGVRDGAISLVDRPEGGVDEP